LSDMRSRVFQVPNYSHISIIARGSQKLFVERFSVTWLDQIHNMI
jgi:hypothetical protein